MGLDLLIPFGILLALVVYLIYSRSHFEKDIVKLYEQKFEEWKTHNGPTEPQESKRELVGLVFKKDGKIDIEVFESRVDTLLKRGKFSTKVK